MMIQPLIFLNCVPREGCYVKICKTCKTKLDNTFLTNPYMPQYWNNRGAIFSLYVFTWMERSYLYINKFLVWVWCVLDPYCISLTQVHQAEGRKFKNQLAGLIFVALESPRLFLVCKYSEELETGGCLNLHRTPVTLPLNRIWNFNICFVDQYTPGQNSWTDPWE